MCAAARELAAEPLEQKAWTARIVDQMLAMIPNRPETTLDGDVGANFVAHPVT